MPNVGFLPFIARTVPSGDGPEADASWRHADRRQAPCLLIDRAADSVGENIAQAGDAASAVDWEYMAYNC